MGLLLWTMVALIAPFCGGCNGFQLFAVGAGDSILTLSPGSTTVPVGAQVSLMLLGADAYSCAWQPSDTSVVSVVAPGVLKAKQPGSVTVNVTCAQGSTSATVLVTQPAYSAPIVITQGGTYTGRWLSTDPNVPPIRIQTDAPVIIKDSVVMGPNFLIMGYGGSHLTVQNVIGVEQPSPVAGMANGGFIYIERGVSLDVNHCTMNGVAFGIYLGGGVYSSLNVTNNFAIDMDDRESNGHGGMLDQRGTLGHFLIFDGVSAPSGANLAWNQVIDKPGISSVEDIININGSSGGSMSTPIRIHDNYLEGALAYIGAAYSGGGITTDGPNQTGLVPAFVAIDHNQIVVTQNNGIYIAVGHDVAVTDNRVVSSGIDSAGNWTAPADTLNWAYRLQNYAHSDSYFNNTISGNYSGMTRLDPSKTPVRADLWAPDTSATLGNTATQMDYVPEATDPGAVTRASEQAERELWYAKLETANMKVGASLIP